MVRYVAIEITPPEGLFPDNVRAVTGLGSTFTGVKPYSGRELSIWYAFLMQTVFYFDFLLPNCDKGVYMNVFQ